MTLLVEIGGQRFAAPLAAVREVFSLGPLTPVPAGPAGLAGLVNLRGQVVPVLDPAALLGVGAHRMRLGDPVVLVELTDVCAGLLVDHVLGLNDGAAGAAELDIPGLLARTRGGRA